MPYQYTTFDGVDLPIIRPQTDLSSGAVDSALVDSIGGAFDVVGVGGLRLPRKSTVTVNPDHLFPGTDADNMADKKQKNRQAKGEAVAHSKLKESDVIEIRRLYKEGMDNHSKKYSSANLAKMYGVNKKTVLAIINRKTWLHI